jgi:4-hydroxyphenylpyruvate dioxygenase
VAGEIDEDMHWLASQAAERHLRIAYEGMAWSTINNNLPAAWACVQRVGAPNMGVVVDAFHIFARGRDAGDLDGIPADRIFLVQLSDVTETVNADNVVEVARHRRLLPGQGRFPVDTILSKLKQVNYSGPIGLEVFNDVMKSRDPYQITREAMAALNTAWK